MVLTAGAAAAVLLMSQVTVMENSNTVARRPVPEGQQTRQVCRRQRVTGSNFTRMVCRERAFVRQDGDDARESLRRLQGSRLPDGQ